MISGEVDTIVETTSKSVAESKELEAVAIQRSIDAGATEGTVTVIASESIPIGYMEGRSRIMIKAAGEWNGAGYAGLPFDVTEEDPPKIT